LPIQRGARRAVWHVTGAGAGFVVNASSGSPFHWYPMTMLEVSEQAPRRRKAERFTPKLRALIEKVRSLARFDAASLTSTLGEADIEFDDISRFVRFRARGYARVLVFQQPGLELRLLCWLPGQTTPLHSHGPSLGVFKVIRGTATESVLGQRDRKWAPRSVVADDSSRVHQVSNTETDALLTLHIYCPSLHCSKSSRARGRHVVIVGGGFSGAAVAYHLLQGASADTHIHIVEKGPWIGRGIAYGVESDCFRLNVPASRMSIDPAKPDDFVSFANAHGDPHAFLSRALYGRYVCARFGRALEESAAQVHVWRDEATRITGGGVELASGRRLVADAVVVATGLSQRLGRDVASRRIVDAWDECALAGLPERGRLMILGSGLSALDVLAFLDARGFDGRATLVSPRGLVPLPHAAVSSNKQAPPPLDISRAPTTLRALVRWVREAMEDDVQAGAPWQSVVDRVRPHVATLYRRLSPRDRARFVRHVRPYWDVFRHRAPRESLDRLRDWLDCGRLDKVAGRVTVLRADASRVRVSIAERTGVTRVESFDAVVRCIGPALKVTDGESPLICSLVEAGLARRAASGLGVDTDQEGRILDATGYANPRLVAIGALRRASDWETTSVPDIAAHARAVAVSLRRIIEPACPPLGESLARAGRARP
jgi:uncharacterized NAD(P)/FAD-binding protein YdhS